MILLSTERHIIPFDSIATIQADDDHIESSQIDLNNGDSIALNISFPELRKLIGDGLARCADQHLIIDIEHAE